MRAIIDKLERTHNLSDEEFMALLKSASPADDAELAQRARKIRERYYGKDVYIRGLIEFTNYCRNNCYYCGIRRDNSNAQRYRLTAEQILACCDTGYQLGCRTFVLQGGEDAYFTDERLCELLQSRPGLTVVVTHDPVVDAAGRSFLVQKGGLVREA